MKNANLLVIGGPISSGKSTLANNLPFSSINEIDEENKIQKIFLETTYSKKRVAPEVIEFYFLQVRKINYYFYAKQKSVQILDRSIFESLWFAKENLSKKSFKYFNLLFNQTIKELINICGKPQLYILLNINWKNFCIRLFKRNHKEEIMNFEKNKKFFQKHVKNYVTNLKLIFEKYSLKYIIIDTNDLSTNEVYSLAWKFVKENKYENK